MGTPARTGVPAKVLVVEDEPIVRDLLVTVMRTEGYEVVAAADAGAALKQAKSFQPQLALIDVRLGSGPDGFAVARRLREEADLSLLFLTSADEAEDIRAGFAAGAELYVTKPFSVDSLLVQIEAVLAKAGKSRDARWEMGDVVIDEAARAVTRAAQPLDLTPIEFELLCHLVRRAGRVVTKSQLLSELWGYRDYSPNVVERHVSALRHKLEANGPRLIYTVHSAGYVFRP
ncbi:MAG TPA: response regulator transcription factor [Acidimicrobiales bacterium]|jgi:DNA-binding response OmpR family regulator|nr:response regulator transcription factor [Acidimicrobiales bacterium]